MAMLPSRSSHQSSYVSGGKINESASHEIRPIRRGRFASSMMQVDRLSDDRSVTPRRCVRPFKSAACLETATDHTITVATVHIGTIGHPLC